MFKILKTTGRKISIGIADTAEINNRWCKDANAIYYSGYDGYIGLSNEAGKFSEGKGFKEGDEVVLEVDLISKVIKWFVNDQRKGSISTPAIFKRKGIAFVPFISFFNSGAIIEFID